MLLFLFDEGSTNRDLVLRYREEWKEGPGDLAHAWASWFDARNVLEQLAGYLWGQTFEGGASLGLILNIGMTLVGLTSGIALGVPLGVVRFMAPLWLRAPISAVLALLRATPLLLLILWLYLFVQVVLTLDISPPWIGAGALGVYSVVWISDAVLAGTKAVPPEQIRAARALGFGRLGVARHVIVPIAWRVMLPALTSFATTLFKDSSFCYVIGVNELMQLGWFEATRNPSQILQIYGVIGTMFFVFALAGTRLAAKLEQRARIRGLLS